MAAQTQDIMLELTGDILDEFTIFASGSTPVTVAEMIESNINYLPVPAVGRFASLMIIAAIGQRRIIEEYLARPINTDLLGFVKQRIYIGEKVNFSNLNLSGHCIMAAAGDTTVGMIAAFRTKLGADNIWECNFNRCSLSAKQIDIFKERVQKFRYNEAFASGDRILKVLLARSRNEAIVVDAADNPPPPPTNLRSNTPFQARTRVNFEVGSVSGTAPHARVRTPGIIINEPVADTGVGTEDADIAAINEIMNNPDPSAEQIAIQDPATTDAAAPEITPVVENPVINPPVLAQSLIPPPTSGLNPTAAARTRQTAAEAAAAKRTAAQAKKNKGSGSGTGTDDAVRRSDRKRKGTEGPSGADEDRA